MTVLVDLVFRGDIVSGKNIFEVKEALQARFKLKDADVEKLFSGKPVILKRGLSEDDADKFRGLLHQSGALVDTRIRTIEGGEVPARAPSLAEKSDGISIGALGADFLTDQERSTFTPADIDLSNISLSPSGEDVLDDNDKKPFVPTSIDTDHLKLDPDE